MVLETQRLILREITQGDLTDLCKVLQDDDVMYAYEGAFNIYEVQSWLNRQIERYKEHGFGLWAVVLKDTDIMKG